MRAMHVGRRARYFVAANEGMNVLTLTWRLSFGQSGERQITASEKPSRGTIRLFAH